MHENPANLRLSVVMWGLTAVRQDGHLEYIHYIGNVYIWMYVHIMVMYVRSTTSLPSTSCVFICMPTGGAMEREGAIPEAG